MDAARTDFPPAPHPAAPSPLPPAAPGVGVALGMIALYFTLQIAIGALAALLLGVVFGIAHHGVAGSLIANPDFMSALVTLTLVGDALVMLWLIHRQWPRWWSQAAPPGFGLVAPTLAWCVTAVTLGLAVALLGARLTGLLAHGHAVPQDVKQMGGDASFGMRIVLTLVVASIGPLVEELLFRGLLLSALLRHLRVGWAILASALLFGLVHLPDLKWLWYAVPNLVLVGAVLAWLRLRSRSLWPAVIAHASNNLLGMLALFVSLHHPG